MKLMLIGGGENGRGDKPYETKEIDEEIVKMTGKEKPNFLFIGLASNFSDSYYDVMKVIYKNLGCETVYLKKKNVINNPDIVKNKIENADIIYMCGGDTTKLVNTMKEYGIDKLLEEKTKTDCVLAGISAGAIALCNSGLSDYQILNNISDKYAFTEGLGFYNLDICPHGDLEQRITDLKEIIKGTEKKVLVLENGTALKVEDDKTEVIRSLKARTYFTTYKEDYIEEDI